MESSPMLDAFISQAYGPHGGVDGYCANLDATLKASNDIRNEWIKKAKEQIHQDQSINKHMNIPSEITEDDINQKTTPHEKLANYDHSMEQNRLTNLREKYNYIEPTTDSIDSPDAITNTEAYENIDPSEVPDLSGLFDGTFNI